MSRAANGSNVSSSRARVDGDTTAASVEERLALLVGRTRRLLWAAVTRSLDEHGESVHLYRTLAHLIRHGASTQKELAGGTLQHPAAISRLLEILDRRGLVRRQRDRQDRRVVRVAPTAAGRARFRQLAPAVRLGVTQALHPLPLPDRRRLVALLGKLTAASDTVEQP